MKVGQELWEGLMTLSGGREPRHLGEGASVLPLPVFPLCVGSSRLRVPGCCGPSSRVLPPLHALALSLVSCCSLCQPVEAGVTLTETTAGG